MELSGSRDGSRSRSPSMVVMRPPLDEKSTPIPENLKQKKERLDKLDKQIEALTKIKALICRTEGDKGEKETQETGKEMMPSPPLPQKKPRIRVIENIQLVPPSTSDGQAQEQENLVKDVVEVKNKE